MRKSLKLFIFVLHYLRDFIVNCYELKKKSCMGVVLIKSNKIRKTDKLLV